MNSEQSIPFNKKNSGSMREKELTLLIQINS